MLKVNLIVLEDKVPKQVLMYQKFFQEAMLINTKVPLGKQICD